MFKVEQLPLWDVLKTVDDAQRAKVRKLIEGAAAILDRVIETFPTYTLHNSTHAENVVKLMADLLGDRVKDLTPLEAALLILSAFYHDIGMVFREDERNRLTEEPEWETFLDAKPDAYLAVKKAGEVPLDIAEWYCRWRHADRVYVYLNRLPDDLLKWGQTSIREGLGDLCRSHNLPAADLPKLLRTDFRSGEADLCFCAVLLRLADILDFDRTRSPEAVYEHLGLSRRIDPRQDASDVEWLKHLCSEGFRFPEKRSDGYPLGFVAGPDEPGVEHDVREFLRVIEEEMEQCRVLLTTCSECWRTLPLPGSIDRSDILSNGYRYGEYRFTLDQEQVMDLLMGENLYENPYVFVRELIQNALDATRHRRFIERASGNLGYEPKPIQVRHWINRDGYQWVRFDDYGMGMDEEIVKNHLLKVGSSFYRTSAFRAEVLRVQEKTQEDFVPISRFGIGLLSCFISGDQIEISTLRRALQGSTEEPIRLSLNGLHGFFTLRTPHLPDVPMPAPDAKEPGYRVEPGTSIAVRFDPTREKKPFDPKALLKFYVACPPVPIEFDGERIGGNPAILLDRPWCERVTVTATLSPEQNAALKKTGWFQQPIEVEFLPIDLTRHSPSHELKGQILFISLKSAVRWRKPKITHAQLAISDDCSHIKIAIYDQEQREFTLPIELPGIGLREIIRTVEADDLAWFSHNGVAVPTNGPDENQWLDLGGYFSSRPHWQRGLIAVTDSLRPDVSISRGELRGLPLRLYSAAGLALYKALGDTGENLRSDLRIYEAFSEFLPSQSLRLEDLLADQYLKIDGPWSQLPIFYTNRGLQSLHEIRDTVDHNPILLADLPFQQPYGGFLTWCAATLAQVGLNVSAQIVQNLPDSEIVRVFATKGSPAVITEGHKLFPPLMFLPFIGSKRLRSIWAPVINARHPFAGWLIEQAPEIARRYPGLFERIRSILIMRGREFSWSAAVEDLNAVLNRLRDLHSAVRPPKNLVLTREDFFEKP